MIQTTTICPACGDHIELADRHCWVATCVNQCALGLGETPEDALKDWGRYASDIRAAALSSLATFVVPEPPEGFGFTVTKYDDVLGEYEIHPTTLDAALEQSCTFGDRLYYGHVGQKAANQ